MKHGKKIRLFCGMAALMLLLSACAPTAAEESVSRSEPSEATSSSTAVQPETESTAVPTSSAEPEQELLGVDAGETEIPLLMTRGDQKHMDAYRMFWDYEKGELREDTLFYSLENISSVIRIDAKRWSGNGYVVSFAESCAETMEVAPGVEVDEASNTTTIPYGLSYFPYSSRSKFYVSDGAGGAKMTVEMPEPVPAEIYDASRLSSDPHYIGVFDDTALVVYAVYHGAETDTGDIVYCTYPVSDPSQASWRVVPLTPEEHPSYLFVTFSAAYADGTLYFATLTELLMIDIATGELSCSETIDRVRALCPEGTYICPEDGWKDGIMIYGVWNNTIVADMVLYLPDGTSRIFNIALRGNELLGVMESYFAAERRFVFYNADLQVINTDDSLGDYEFCAINFARDD
ncbi:MAG: hypothetical protein ACI4V3_02395 [Faecousia sp.]